MHLNLVGQPNAGRSTLFNAMAGYKTVVANFPGTSLEVTESQVTVDGHTFVVRDLPGLYSLCGEEARDVREALLAPDSVAVHVIDTSLLGRSLELTLELLELGVPLVVALNMMDEAERKGVRVDVGHLAQDLGVPVVPLIATQGHGLGDLLRAARTGARPGRIFPMSRDVEEAVEAVQSHLRGDGPFPPRFLALQLLEQEEDLVEDPRAREVAARERQSLEARHGRPADVVLSSERHALAMNLFEHVATVRTRAPLSWRGRLDGLVLHPWGGPAVLVAVLMAFFYLVFGLGRRVEAPLLALFDHLSTHLAAVLPPDTLAWTLVTGLVQGFSGGVGIVLPYLVPFLVGLAVLEDLGYIPRAAFVMDGVMHRMGLHGKAIIPFVLGYGCTVPAIMGTRILESRRDRLVTAVLVNFIPCAARTTVVFAVAGAVLGPFRAMGFFALSVAVIGLCGWLLVRIRPEATPGLVLDIPSWRRPALGAILAKTWFRMREFIVIAWPVLIVGSVLLGLLEHFDLDGWVNAALSPFTRGVLGLPEAAGVTLIFGVLRKELAVVMLVQALGTADFAAALTPAQVASLTAFSVFYVPCLATLAMLKRVVGTRGMLFSVVFTTALATAVAVAFRGVFTLLG